MRWTTHAVVGAAAGSVIASATGSDFVYLMSLGALFGVLPDIDMVASGLSRNAHRSPATHSVFGAAILTAVWVVIYLGAQTLVGQESAMPVSLLVSSATVFSSSFLHAAVDTVSVSGCKALYPFSRRKFRGPVKYDDWAANSTVVVVAMGVILASITMDLSEVLAV